MPEDLRWTVEKDLLDTIEGDWAIPVKLKGPDGTEYSTSANSPDPLSPLPLRGQYIGEDARRQDMPDTEYYGHYVVNTPTVTLRVSSLQVVPKEGELWVVIVRAFNHPNAPEKVYVVESARRDNGTLGLITLFLRETSA